MRHKGLIVGIKTAHYMGPDFTAVDRAVEAGTMADIPVMVDFGRVFPQKSLAELLTKKLRPGDIYTHVYSGLRGELDPSGHANPALFEGRKRGVIFDVGHGGGSFAWRVAVPIIQEGFLPDSISTDLHAGSAIAGMKDMLNVMSKFLALGLSLDEVILRSTWNPAREIKQEQLGHLSVGAPADVAVLRLEKGDFGFLDVYGARLRGNPEADLRDDPARRQDRLRAERPVPPRLDHAAQGLSVHGRSALGWDPRVERQPAPARPSSTHRKLSIRAMFRPARCRTGAIRDALSDSYLPPTFSSNGKFA